jgi:hypothetical protein
MIRTGRKFKDGEAGERPMAEVYVLLDGRVNTRKRYHARQKWPHRAATDWSLAQEARYFDARSHGMFQGLHAPFVLRARLPLQPQPAPPS